MSTQPITQQVRWQDLAVRSEIDIVFEIAQQEGWEDCETFGFGDMITEPQDSLGWKLIPADVYKYSIPAEGVRRVHQLLNAGIRIQGIIIADDERGTAPPSGPARLENMLSSIKSGISTFVAGAASVLLGLIRLASIVVGFMALAALAILTLKYLVPLIILGLLVGMGAGSAVAYDPKLVILVNDGNGGTVWISLFTWYE